MVSVVANYLLEFNKVELSDNLSIDTINKFYKDVENTINNLLDKIIKINKGTIKMQLKQIQYHSDIMDIMNQNANVINEFLYQINDLYAQNNVLAHSAFGITNLNMKSDIIKASIDLSDDNIVVKVKDKPDIVINNDKVVVKNDDNDEISLW